MIESTGVRILVFYKLYNSNPSILIFYKLRKESSKKPIPKTEEDHALNMFFNQPQKRFMRISLSSQKMIAKKLIFEAKKLERALKATFLLAVFFEKSYTLVNP